MGSSANRTSSRWRWAKTATPRSLSGKSKERVRSSQTTFGTSRASPTKFAPQKSSATSSLRPQERALPRREKTLFHDYRERISGQWALDEDPFQGHPRPAPILFTRRELGSTTSTTRKPKQRPRGHTPSSSASSRRTPRSSISTAEGKAVNLYPVGARRQCCWLGQGTGRLSAGTRSRASRPTLCSR